MSVKHALSRGLELGRSLLFVNLKPGARVAARLRVGGASVPAPQPRIFLPSRYRYYRSSLRGLAARMLASVGFRSSGGSPRNRAVFLAFGLGVGLVEQLEEDRRSTATCEEIQAVFRRKRFPSSMKPIPSGYKLHDYIIGAQIGKGSNAVVRFPLAIKMMWNFGAGSSSEAILSSMSQELVPAGRLALKPEGEEPLDGRVSAHPNVIRVHRAFTAEVPLLPGAREEYPDVLPARLNPGGLGNNRTLFLVMKSYPGTLRQFLSGNQPSRRQRVLMLLQLLEGVQHLCSEGVAHRDLKTDNILLELDSDLSRSENMRGFKVATAVCSFPFNSMWVSRGGNACLMAPAVSSASPGRASLIDYRKADGWAVGAVAYEIFGEQNPFYGAGGCRAGATRRRSCRLPPPAPADVQLVIQLLLRRSPSKRPSARVAANMLHLSLWGGRALSDLRKLSDWLLCQSAVVLLGGCRAGRVHGGGGASEELPVQPGSGGASHRGGLPAVRPGGGGQRRLIRLTFTLNKRILTSR
ncbi:Serine/threonine-protein kinase PINK1 mitochondrial [Dissostichus eleginoides]|uniref:non-specific serine/threonine protein kinase n=1 Tax=Dissostichus eleginoides TaxID=100907 RepID=A0AAD9CBE9_DISEL|nr:Serine/threonine-protein kinase PINK1 mitochondrial [Dissostichus eleginoides]